MEEEEWIGCVSWSGVFVENLGSSQKGSHVNTSLIQQNTKEVTLPSSSTKRCLRLITGSDTLKRQTYISIRLEKITDHSGLERLI